MYETDKKIPDIMLVSVDTGEYDAEDSLDELEELTETAYHLHWRRAVGGNGAGVFRA